MDKRGGIYTITSPSGNQYIGSTTNFARRWREHRSDLRLSKHHSIRLQRAYNKYGEDALTFAVLFVAAPADLLMFEQRAVDALAPRYNCTDIAGRPIITEETRRKMSLARKGVPTSELHRRRTSEGLKGYIKSAEHVAQIAQARVANPNWKETCERISAKLKGRPASGKGRKGIPHSDESRAALSLSVSAAKSTSGIRGVSFNVQVGKWKAVRRVGRVRKYLGYFETKEQARDAILADERDDGYAGT